MRRLVSIVIAVILFLIIIYLAVSGYIVMSDFWTGLSIALIPIALAILFWGFKPQIYGFLKKNGKTKRVGIKTEPIEKKESRSTLLPDSTDIMKLNINEELLDQIYEQARSQAVGIHHDAKLSSFMIQVFPFQKVVSIFMDFYSKWTDRTYTFKYSDFELQVKHVIPDKFAKNDYTRKVFSNLPWKESPQWMQFLNMAYVRIKPIQPAARTYYYLLARAYSKNAPWILTFEDGFTGKDYVFEWNGKGLDKNSIKQIE
jgi:hypothetical protein